MIFLQSTLVILRAKVRFGRFQQGLYIASLTWPCRLRNLQGLDPILSEDLDKVDDRCLRYRGIPFLRGQLDGENVVHLDHLELFDHGSVRSPCIFKDVEVLKHRIALKHDVKHTPANPIVRWSVKTKAHRVEARLLPPRIIDQRHFAPEGSQKSRGEKPRLIRAVNSCTPEIAAEISQALRGLITQIELYAVIGEMIFRILGFWIGITEPDSSRVILHVCGSAEINRKVFSGSHRAVRDKNGPRLRSFRFGFQDNRGPERIGTGAAGTCLWKKQETVSRYHVNPAAWTDSTELGYPSVPCKIINCGAGRAIEEGVRRSGSDSAGMPGPQELPWDLLAGDGVGAGYNLARAEVASARFYDDLVAHY